MDAMVPLDDAGDAYERLLARIGDARFVLLGEATHGSHEFYRERAILTERLILEKGFDAVAVEADWPDARRVHRFIRGEGDDESAEDALRGFQRFPRWMWRNRDTSRLVEWLRTHAPGVGFYGLDLYGLHGSIASVLAWLDEVDAGAARRARDRYACFDAFGRDGGALASGAGLGTSCAREVREQLLETRALLRDHAGRSPTSGEGWGDRLFDVEVNAQLACAAEAYYRNMPLGGVATWNLRDRQMAATLGAVAAHLDRRLGRPSRLVVWAHNSHVGDARATEMGRDGEVSLGQLLRERYGRDAFSVGFTTYGGMVTAAPDWGAKAARAAVRPAVPNSHELILHLAAMELGVGDVLDVLIAPDERGRLPELLRPERLLRSIGVVYRPRTERSSHWFRARLAEQFDAVVHLDRTTAVEPLDRVERREGEDLPETYPFAV